MTSTFKGKNIVQYVQKTGLGIYHVGAKEWAKTNGVITSKLSKVWIARNLFGWTPEDVGILSNIAAGSLTPLSNSLSSLSGLVPQSATTLSKLSALLQENESTKGRGRRLDFTKFRQTFNETEKSQEI